MFCYKYRITQFSFKMNTYYEIQNYCRLQIIDTIFFWKINQNPLQSISLIETGSILSETDELCFFPPM